MAKVLGKSGRYVSDQAAAKRRQIWLRYTLLIGLLCLADGLLIGSWLPLGNFSHSARLLMMLGLLILTWWIFRRLSKQADVLEKERAAMHRGAIGEIAVGRILETFPDDFFVINDGGGLKTG